MPRLVHAAQLAAATRYETVAGELLGTASAAPLIADRGLASRHPTPYFAAESDGWQPAQLLAAALRRGPLGRRRIARASARLADRRRCRERFTRRASGATELSPTPSGTPTSMSAATGHRPDPAAALVVPAALRVEPTHDPAATATPMCQPCASGPSPSMSARHWAPTGEASKPTGPGPSWPASSPPPTTAASQPPVCSKPQSGLRAETQRGSAASCAGSRANAGSRPTSSEGCRTASPQRHPQPHSCGLSLADQARAEAAWAALQAVVRCVHHIGHDAEALLRTVADARTLTNAATRSTPPRSPRCSATAPTAGRSPCTSSPSARGRPNAR